MFKRLLKIGFIWVLLAGNALKDTPARAQPEMDELLKAKTDFENKLQDISTITILLSNPAAVKEIDAIPDQVAAAHQIVADSSVLVTNHYNSLGQIDPDLEERAKSGTVTANDMVVITAVYKKGVNALNQVDSRLEEVFLPHQLHRFHQLIVQHTALINNPYGSDVGLVFGLADRLGLNPAEKEELGKLIQEGHEEYLQRTEELRDELNKKLVDSLSPVHREKYLALVGNRFDVQKESRRLRREVSKRESN